MPSSPSTGPLARLKSASPSTFEPLSRLKSTSPFTIENRSSQGLSSGGLPAQTADTSTASRDVQSLQHRFEKTTVARQRLEKLQLKFAATEFNKALRTHNLSPPKPMDNFTINSGVTTYLIDRNKQSVFSEYIRRSGCQLPEFVRLLRGESVSDSRPNKALHVPTGVSGLEKYRYRSQWDSIVKNGVIPAWKCSFKSQVTPPPNHGSARRALNIIIKQLRAGQDSNRYLILDINLLPVLHGITCSPFGAVQKGDVDLSIDARIIHDLSFPQGDSVNDNTLADHEVEVCYDGPDALARRCLKVAKDFPGLQRMMTGDVNGAFRNIPVSSDHVGRFAGTIPEFGILVIDLCCPFGWENSPSSYWVAGAAIGHLYENMAPKWSLQPDEGKRNFDAKIWCDDHIAIEPDIGSRLSEAQIALRTAMTTILGPDACNNKKFTSWCMKNRALGLDWDLSAQTVSMPLEKISKALHRLQEMLKRDKTTRTQLLKFLGSLRHVVTCIRPAAPFFQRVAALSRRAPRYGGVEVSADAKDDLHWFAMIMQIGHLNSVPLARFTRQHEANVNIHMDASDRGLCALFPARKQFLQVKFTDEELELVRRCNETGDSTFCINVRELMSAVFACLVWGHVWKSADDGTEAHTRFWIDNMSAVAWNNHKTSRNSFAQMLLRIMGICEVQHGFYSTAAHVAGVDNQMADAGSRVWQSPTLASEFSNLCAGWTQVQIPTDWRNLSRLWARCCEQGRLPNLPGSTTLVPGISGRDGAI